MQSSDGLRSAVPRRAVRSRSLFPRQRFNQEGGKKQNQMFQLEKGEDLFFLHQ